MANTQFLSDITSEISPLVTDILNYELRIRGIQPAQAPTVKRAQLAKELLKEKQGAVILFNHACRYKKT